MKHGTIIIGFVLVLSLAACSLAPGAAPQASAPPPDEPAASAAAAQAASAPTAELTPDSESDTAQQGTTENQSCPSGSVSLAIMVDPGILDGIRPGLTQFEDDLRQAGFEVIETSEDFATPLELRAALSDLYQSTEECLAGAYLIGDIPYAYQWFRVEYANPDIPPTEQEVISFQYYADLDGVFRASEDYISPGGHEFSYDIHEGDLDWEIWVGVLPFYKGDADQTIQAINRYFEKNHAYRQGEYTIPRAFLQIYEFQTATTQEDHDRIEQQQTSGQYAWTPFSSSPDAQLYFDSPPADMTVEQGYRALSEGTADFTAVSAHGSWKVSGSIDINWIESNPVETVFYRTSGCSTGDLDHDDNFLTSVLYSPTSTVLVAWGASSPAGGMGNNTDGFFGHNVASDLSEGKSFGEAILEHVNTPLIPPWSEDRELHFSVQVFLGDPSLTLFP
jgi:hypothetical protein